VVFLYLIVLQTKDAMKVSKTPIAQFITELGQWARPKTPEGKRAADITAFALIIAAALALLYILR
jgi:hypothetical protein